MSRLECQGTLKYKYARVSKFVIDMITHYVVIAHPQKIGKITAPSNLSVFSRTVWRFLPAFLYSTAPKYHIESKLKKLEHAERNKYIC